MRKPRKKAQPRDDRLTIESLLVFDPLTDNQSKVYEAWDKHPVIVLSGCAGTGKTFSALYKSLEDVLDAGNQYHRLIIVRSAVPARNIGFTPGTVEEKAMPFERPYKGMVPEMFGRKDAYEKLKEQGRIIFDLSSYERGVTFDNSIVIVDEFENMEYRELATIITRIGKDSKIIFSGDTAQNDIGSKSGADRFLSVLDRMKSCFRVDFGIEDIVRGSVPREFLLAEYDFNGVKDAGI